MTDIVRKNSLCCSIVKVTGYIQFLILQRLNTAMSLNVILKILHNSTYSQVLSRVIRIRA